MLCVLGLTWPEGKDDLGAKKAKTGEKEEKEQEAQDAWKPLPRFDILSMLYLLHHLSICIFDFWLSKEEMSISMGSLLKVLPRL